MKILSALLLTAFCLNQMYAQTTFYLVTFEDGDPNAGTYTPTTDVICTSSRYFARADDSQISTNAAADYLGEVGTKYWAGEAHDDVADNGTCPQDGLQNNAKSVVFGPISISGKSDLSVRLYVASNGSATDRFECDDRIDVTYNIDGGATQTAFSFRTDESPATCASGGTPEELRQDKDLNGTGDAGEPALGQTFQQFQSAITGTGSNITVTVTFDNDAQTEEMAIDHFELIENSGLPVELTYFRSSVINSHIKLEWETASELNNSGFEIQKSKDGQEWETIEFITGMGTSTEFNRYEFIDYKPIIGIGYYRLKQIDFDGVFELSNVVSTNFIDDNKVEIYPNPSRERFNILGIEEGEIIIYDNVGREVKRVNFVNSEINISDLSTGFYSVQIISNNKTTIKKLIKE